MKFKHYTVSFCIVLSSMLFYYFISARESQVPLIYGNPNLNDSCAKARSRHWELFRAQNLTEMETVQEWLDEYCKGRGPETKVESKKSPESQPEQEKPEQPTVTSEHPSQPQTQEPSPEKPSTQEPSQEEPPSDTQPEQGETPEWGEPLPLDISHSRRVASKIYRPLVRELDPSFYLGQEDRVVRFAVWREEEEADDYSPEGRITDWFWSRKPRSLEDKTFFSVVPPAGFYIGDPPAGSTDENANRRSLHAMVFLRNRASGHRGTRDLLLNRNLYRDWQEGEEPDVEKLAVITSFIDDRMLVVRQDESIEVPHVKADYFNRIGVMEEEVLFQRLCYCVAVEPNLKLLRLPEEGDKSFFVLGPEENPFLIGFRYAANAEHEDEFIPFEPIQLQDVNGRSEESTTAYLRYLRQLIDNDKEVPAPLRRITEEFNETGSRRNVTAIMPTHLRPTHATPLGILGVSDGSYDQEPPVIKRALQNLEPLNYIIEDESRQQVEIWRSNHLSKSWGWYEEVQDKRNPWLRWLALATDRVKIIAQSGAKSRICMICDQWPSQIWRWEGTGVSHPPHESRIIDGDSTFFLTDTPQKQFVDLVRGGARGAFENFLLNESFQVIILLDYFASTRMLLFERRNDLNITAGFVSRSYRLSESSNQMYEIDFRGVCKSVVNKLAGIIDFYKDFGRDSLLKSILRHENSSMQVWWGDKRMAIYILTPELVSVYMHNQRRPFGPTNLKKLESLIRNNIVYRKSSNNTLRDDLFEGWLSPSDWRKSLVWRADPLGYFDAVANRSTYRK